MLKSYIDNATLAAYHYGGSPATRIKPTLPGRLQRLVLLLILSCVTFTAFCCPSVCAGSDGKFPGVGSIDVWRKASAVYNEGLDLYDARKYKESIAKFNEAIGIYAYDSQYFEALASAHYSLQNRDTAEAFFKKAIQLEPKFARAWFNLGLLQYDMHKDSEAEQSFINAKKYYESPAKKQRAQEQIDRIRAEKLRKAG